MNKTIIYGLLAGVIYAFFSFVLYLMGMEVELGLARLTKMLPFLFVLIIIIVFGFMLRKEEGGFMSYKEAFFALLSMFIIAEFVHVLYLYLLYNVIDPELPHIIKNIAIEKFEETESELGSFLSDAQVERIREELENQDPSYTLGKAFKEFLGGSFLGLILSALTAFILKKEKPLFD